MLQHYWMPQVTINWFPKRVKHPIPFRQFIPAILWFLLLCVLVFMPGSDVPSIGWAQQLHIDKIVHFFLFGMLFLLTALPILKSSFSVRSKKQYLFSIAISAILWGILTEIIQHYFVAGRTFDIGDWIADTIGILTGVWVATKLKRMFTSVVQWIRQRC